MISRLVVNGMVRLCLCVYVVLVLLVLLYVVVWFVLTWFYYISSVLVCAIVLIVFSYCLQLYTI